MFPISEQDKREFQELKEKGERINTIKKLHNMTGLGLKESKQLVDDIWDGRKKFDDCFYVVEAGAAIIRLQFHRTARAIERRVSRLQEELETLKADVIVALQLAESLAEDERDDNILHRRIERESHE